MKRWGAILCALSAWISVPAAGLTQSPEETEQTRTPGLNAASDQKQSQTHKRKELPKWLKLGAEVRGRAESGYAFDATTADNRYLNRMRLNVTVSPAPWVQVFFQGQDARVISVAAGHDREGLRDVFDLRQAYINFGRGEEGWQLRVGRQELALGDERLVGADSYWDCLGQGFDAVRLGFAGTRFRAAAFTGFRVQPSWRRWDPLSTDNRISGFSVQFKTGDAFLEPYLVWKRGSDTRDLMEHHGHRDVLTPGLRTQGPLPYSLDYNAEMALQRGHVVADRISAWAGHWELGWRPLGEDFGPRLSLEYNYASGDRNPSDGNHETFDDLYPAGFNKYGMADLIAWRNIRYPGIGVEVPFTKRWTIYGGYRRYWLASVYDGLYPGGDEYMVRNPAAISSAVGSNALVSVGYARSEHWKVYAGYGYLFPGEYLRQSGYQTAVKTAYVLSSFTF